jgi:hypothetical protein
MFPKLSAACLVIRKLFPVLNSVSLQMAYVAYFQSFIKYGIFFLGGGGIQLMHVKFLNYKRR